MLRALDELAAQGSPSAALRLAAWYHDAVYDPTAAAGDNERRSAELAERGRLGVAAPLLVADVARWFGPLPPTGSTVSRRRWWRRRRCSSMLISPCSVVRPPSTTATPTGSEYGHLDEATYRRRAAVLQRFAERDRLYSARRRKTPVEAAARANLDRELAALRGS
ncbi:MAG: hypothetical protein R2749_21975 [Acidimicrobiales bacterium]